VLPGDVDAAGAAAIISQGEINVLLRKATYTDADRARILELLTELGLRNDDNGSELVVLRRNRGQLVCRPQTGPVEVVAHGRADWLGWVEMKTEAVNEQSTRDTARVIHELDEEITDPLRLRPRRNLGQHQP
jgi:hypothetical protein